jgi:hypothetical protein
MERREKANSKALNATQVPATSMRDLARPSVIGEAAN